MAKGTNGGQGVRGNGGPKGGGGGPKGNGGNWPSTTPNPSGTGRGNAAPQGK